MVRVVYSDHQYRNLLWATSGNCNLALDTPQPGNLRPEITGHPTSDEISTGHTTKERVFAQKVINIFSKYKSGVKGESPRSPKRLGSDSSGLPANEFFQQRGRHALGILKG